MEHLTSLQNPKIRDAIRLKTSRGRRQQNRIIIYGQREVIRASLAGVRFECIFVCTESADVLLNMSELPDVLAPAGRVYDVAANVFEKLSYGERRDGLVAIASRPETSLAGLQPNDGTLIVLEQIEKPGNVGAVFRTADATATAGVILAEPRCDVFHPNAIRSSMATVFSVPTATGTNPDTIKWLQENEYTILVATPHQASELFQTNVAGRSAIVLGNEAAGLSDAWMDGGFGRVCLPMQGTADSLNVSATAAVIMYESYRQRETGS